MADNKYVRKEYKYNDETTAALGVRDALNATKPGEFVFSGGDFKYSDETNNYANQLNQWQKPSAYQSNWQQGLDATINKILNGDKFTYDVNGDALYQQYKDQYVNQGKLAMMDTMGQAQAATGGYGNSYAQSVGQQAYQGYLQQLNDIVPELYQLALDKYNSDRADLYNQYGLLSDRENTDYGRYRDTVVDALSERDYLTNQLNESKRWDYGLYSDSWDREHTLHRDSVADWQAAYDVANNEYWNRLNFDYGKYADDENFRYTEHRNEMADSQWGKNYSLNEAQVAASIGDTSTLKELGYDTSNMSTGGGGGGGVDPMSPSEWAAVRTNALSYYESGGKDALINYLEGLEARGYLTAEETNALLDEIAPVTPPKKGSGGGGESSYVFTTGGGKFAVNTKN